MNNKRRELLKKANNLVESASNIIERALDEEQDSFDNYPESLQDSDRGRAMEAAIDNLEDAMRAIDDLKDYIAAAM